MRDVYHDVSERDEPWGEEMDPDPWQEIQSIPTVGGLIASGASITVEAQNAGLGQTALLGASALRKPRDGSGGAESKEPDAEPSGVELQDLLAELPLMKAELDRTRCQLAARDEELVRAVSSLATRDAMVDSLKTQLQEANELAAALHNVAAAAKAHGAKLAAAASIQSQPSAVEADRIPPVAMRTGPPVQRFGANVPDTSGAFQTIMDGSCRDNTSPTPFRSVPARTLPAYTSPERVVPPPQQTVCYQTLSMAPMHMGYSSPGAISRGAASPVLLARSIASPVQTYAAPVAVTQHVVARSVSPAQMRVTKLETPTLMLNTAVNDSVEEMKGEVKSWRKHIQSEISRLRRELTTMNEMCDEFQAASSGKC